jgi:hypothetical protein
VGDLRTGAYSSLFPAADGASTSSTRPRQRSAVADDASQEVQVYPQFSIVDLSGCKVGDSVVDGTNIAHEDVPGNRELGPERKVVRVDRRSLRVKDGIMAMGPSGLWRRAVVRKAPGVWRRFGRHNKEVQVRSSAGGPLLSFALL